MGTISNHFFFRRMKKHLPFRPELIRNAHGISQTQTEDPLIDISVHNSHPLSYFSFFHFIITVRKCKIVSRHAKRWPPSAIFSIFKLDYSIMEATRPDPTVRPPSRYQTDVLRCANSDFSYDLW